MKKNRIIEKAILLNNKNIEDGLEPSYGFEFEGFIISDPFLDVTGRFQVDPLKEYGEIYIKWVDEIIKNKELQNV